MVSEHYNDDILLLTFHSLDSIIFHASSSIFKPSRSPLLSLLIPFQATSPYPNSTLQQSMIMNTFQTSRFYRNPSRGTESTRCVESERERGKRFEISRSNQPKSNAQRSLDGKERVGWQLCLHIEAELAHSIRRASE